jgi:hypothetical protein
MARDPVSVVYAVLCVASACALLTIVYVSITPVPFRLSKALTADWTMQSIGCDRIERGLEESLVRANFDLYVPEDDLFEQLDLPFDAPLFIAGPLAFNFTGTQLLRRPTGAAIWSWAGNCTAWGRVAPCTALFRLNELTLNALNSDGSPCSFHLLNLKSGSDLWDRKMKFAAVIIVLVLLVHSVLTKVRGTPRANRLDEKLRSAKYLQQRRMATTAAVAELKKAQ